MIRLSAGRIDLNPYPVLTVEIIRIQTLIFPESGFIVLSNIWNTIGSVVLLTSEKQWGVNTKGGWVNLFFDHIRPWCLDPIYFVSFFIFTT